MLETCKLPVLRLEWLSAYPVIEADPRDEENELKRSIRENEVAFCAEVKSWADALCQARPDLPFSGAKIEQYGHGSHQRHDLRFLSRDGQVALCGEVKLPGTAEGRSPYDAALMADAFQKAENIQSRYFFTWNVNLLVLFDRKLWNKPLLERRVREWPLGLTLMRPDDVTRPEVRSRLQEIFLAEFLTDFAAIYEERIEDWGMPPDDIFIGSLESHLHEPVHITANYLAARAESDSAFDKRLQEWLASEMQWTFRRGDHDDWRAVLDRAARTLAYVFANRAIFFEAIRARFPDDLDPLVVPKHRKGPDDLYRRFQQRFQEAVDVTHDYEPIFYPTVQDWAAPHIFAGPGAPDAWDSLLKNIQEFNFRAVPYDVIGKIFQRLISPEERHKFGQHYTSEDIVDVINAFCIRRANTTIFDPACGSGSFLVRAYHRKAFLDPSKSHQELLREIYGCDIALFAAHLATLNLAARHIEDEENYPYVSRRNFFDVEPRSPFCTIPTVRADESEPRGQQPIKLPSDLGAIVGNPPYVRQELIVKDAELKRMLKKRVLNKSQYGTNYKQSKEWLQYLVTEAWPNLVLSRRADLHCYFWPAACRFLRDGGYFGFLTSSSFLDVEYGFALQGWILENFKLVAVLESLDEPWFEDARVKTCVTILQRCSNADERDGNLVKFVRFFRPIAEILGERPNGDEGARQKAAEKLQRLIVRQKTDYRSDELRVIVVQQSELWRQGLEVADLLARKRPNLAQPVDEADEEEAIEPQSANAEELEPDSPGEAFAIDPNGYGGGKWGRYLRAPDLYFDIMRRFGERFVRLGEIADIRFGVKSGCDAFFMPHDVSAKILEDYPDAKSWKRAPLVYGCDRSAVARGRIKVVQAGDGSLHPIESKYLRPEVHSLMQVDRPIMRGAELTRLVLMISKPIEKIADKFVKHYLRYGETQTFASTKSRAVPVPQRTTCAARPRWYDLTGTTPGVAFWPKSQQYRHIIPANPERLVCNCNLYDVTPQGLTRDETAALVAILNCTLVGLFKSFYGRYAGTEGNLKTEVVDVNLLEIPDPRSVVPSVVAKLNEALAGLQSRTVGRMVEEIFMDCHTAERVRRLALTPIGLPVELQQADRRILDDAVFELLGVQDSFERSALIDQLYLETARHYRQIRIVEVQKMEQRSRSRATRYTAHDLAEDIWDTCGMDLKQSLIEWLGTLDGPTMEVTIPVEGKPRYRGAKDLFDATHVYFGKDNEQMMLECTLPEQAALLFELASCGLRGPAPLPIDPDICRTWLHSLVHRIAMIKEKVKELVESRTSMDRLRDQTAELLLDWIIQGKER